MLSFDTVHALTGHLITASHTPPARYPLLLLLFHRRAPHTAPPQRTTRPVTVAVPDLTDSALSTLLHRSAEALHPATDRDPHLPSELRAHADTLLGHLDRAGRTETLVAVAVRYNDRYLSEQPTGDTIRVDAVDVDGRLYQITHHRHENHPTVLVEDRPDPTRAPASRTGLTAILTTAAATATVSRRADRCPA